MYHHDGALDPRKPTFEELSAKPFDSLNNRRNPTSRLRYNKERAGVSLQINARPKHE